MTAKTNTRTTFAIPALKSFLQVTQEQPINYAKLPTLPRCLPSVTEGFHDRCITIYPSVMRLINTTTLQLEEFHGTAPEYAILSHTWEKDEVSFEEFTQPTLRSASQGQGYEKITAACRQALSDQIHYCWVDTCCIAKASSAKLTESINSMFS